jgi:nicotinamide-nucleotide amidase
MQAEVIAVGDELTSGQRLDTNSQWISQRLSDLGICVLYHTTVGDDLGAGVEVFRRALDRADLVVSSGGLGPTADDLTREAVSQAVGAELVMNQDAMDHIKGLFARRRYRMPERNVVQAMFPRGSRMVPNPHGTAPGIDMDVPRDDRKPARLLALPGVPAELRDMWQGTVEPAIVSWLGADRRFIRHRLIRCFGAGESPIEKMLPDLIRRGRVPTVGITASKATITLRITAEGPTPEACYEAMEPTVATIRECLGDLVFGEGDDELHDVVVRMLRERRKTLATVECGSGGILAEYLSEADPEMQTYLGGTIARHPNVRAQVAGIEQSRTAAENLEGEAIVQAMALGCREEYDSDYALALGPFPQGDDDASPPGKVHFALAGPEGVATKSSLFAAHPDIRTPLAVKQALNLLRLTLMK